MRRSLIVWCLIALLSVRAQVRIPGPGGKAPAGGGGITYTGANCNNGTSSGPTSALACSATMSVSTGDEIMVFGTVGDQTSTLSSCSTATGTASVTWTVVSGASNINDTANNETEGACVGNVTSGGTVEPQMNWSVGGSDASIVAAAYSGSSNATDGGIALETSGPGTGSNGITSGTITTTVNNDLLFGGVADTSGSGATLTAGTTSVTFTKRVCTTAWGGQTCFEDGIQSTAGAGTTAAWTTTAGTNHALAALVALKK